MYATAPEKDFRPFATCRRERRPLQLFDLKFTVRQGLAPAVITIQENQYFRRRGSAKQPSPPEKAMYAFVSQTEAKFKISKKYFKKY